MAADWENFLYSCKDCNSLRTHHGQTYGERVSGKGNFFPLTDEDQHITEPSEISSEEPLRLIINPCIENPEEYFIYNLDEGLICAKPTTLGHINMAEKSIYILGLDRVNLVNVRKKKMAELFSQINRIKEYVEFYEDSIDDLQKQKFLYCLKREIEIYSTNFSDGAEYLGLARYMHNKIFKPFFGID